MNGPIVALTGADTIAIDGIPFNSLGKGDVMTGEFPNDTSTVNVGKNGNVIAALNAEGSLFKVTLRVLRGSTEDVYLATREAQWIADPASFTAYTGNFTKRVGDGTGNVRYDNYVAGAGVPTKMPSVKENVGGENDQAIAEHTITFGQAIRAIF
jgi:hypothetical protein